MILFYKQEYPFTKGSRTLDKLTFMRSTGGDPGAEVRFEDLEPLYGDSVPRYFSTLSVRERQQGLKFEGNLSYTARPCHRRKRNRNGQP